MTQSYLDSIYDGEYTISDVYDACHLVHVHFPIIVHPIFSLLIQPEDVLNLGFQHVSLELYILCMRLCYPIIVYLGKHKSILIRIKHHDLV